MKPLLSIVIANYNFGKFLEAAIRSVLDQNEPEVELIIVDGGSTDDSVEIIKKYAERKVVVGSRSRTEECPISYWVSEPDKGQSDAFNKGYAHARGKYLTWLNADDVMPAGCLKKVLDEMRRHPECEWFTGNFLRFNEKDGRICQVNWGPHYFPYCLQRRNTPVMVYGPSTFFSKKIYEEVGRIGVEFKYCMDTDLWIKFIVRGIKQRRVNCFCWAFRMHEDSKTADYEGRPESKSIGAQLRVEHEMSCRREGYAPSSVIQHLMTLWRLLDGSLLKLLWMRRFVVGAIYREAR